MFLFRWVKTIQKTKCYCEITLGVDVLLEAGCSLKQKFRKIYPKLQGNYCAGVSFESADPQQTVSRRLIQQLTRTFNGIWSSKKI